MSDEPTGLAIHDLARIYALEHICRILWQDMVMRMAPPAGVSNEQAARDLAQGLDSTLVDGGELPREFQDMVRAAARRFGEETIANARNIDQMMGRNSG